MKKYAVIAVNTRTKFEDFVDDYETMELAEKAIRNEISFAEEDNPDEWTCRIEVYRDE